MLCKSSDNFTSSTVIWHWKSSCSNRISRVRFEVILHHDKIGTCVVPIASMKRKVLESQIGHKYSGYLWWNRTHQPMTLTYLPCIIGNLFGDAFGLQSMCFRGWCSWAEQSLKYKERAPCSFPEGTSEWGVTGHQPIVFNSDLYHQQYWAHQLWVRKEHSFILSNYFYQPVKIPIWWKMISGNCFLWFIRRKKIEYENQNFYWGMVTLA